MFFVICRRARRATLVMTMGCLLLTFGVEAAEQTFFYTGTVTDVPTELASEFDVGDLISGSYSIDDTVSGSMGTYPALNAFSMDISGYGLSSVGQGDVVVGNDVSGVDNYWLVTLSSGTSLNSGLTPQLHAFQLEDSTAQVLSSSSLSLQPVIPSAFDSPLITVDFGNPATQQLVRLEGRLDTVQVPEPNGLIGIMAIGCVVAMRRRLTRV